MVELNRNIRRMSKEEVKIMLEDNDDIVKTETVFLDDIGNVVEKARAVKFITISYDKNGKRVSESYGVINHENVKK